MEKYRERDKYESNSSMIWDPLIHTSKRKALVVAVVWRVGTKGWSIPRNGFLCECSYPLKQREK